MIAMTMTHGASSATTELQLSIKSTCVADQGDTPLCSGYEAGIRYFFLEDAGRHPLPDVAMELTVVLAATVAGIKFSRYETL